MLVADVNGVLQMRKETRFSIVVAHLVNPDWQSILESEFCKGNPRPAN